MAPPAGDPKPPYLRYAFANVYNYTLLGGAAAAALLAGEPWLLAVAAGAEALWLLFGPDSRLLRKRVWDKKWQADQEEAARAQLAAQFERLPRTMKERYLKLDEKRQQILRLSGENPSFTADLLTGELAKLQRLAASFVELAVDCHRLETYVDEVDFRALERDERRYQKEAADGEGDAARLAKKNLDVLLRRRERLQEIDAYVRRARGQLDLIENTFQLLADQIVTMRSPGELAGQLDELLDGVEAVRATTHEADLLLAQ